jgi:hypothetical protein
MPFQLSYKDESLQNETNITFLGLEMGKFMNCKTHVKLMLHKLGQRMHCNKEYEVS